MSHFKAKIHQIRSLLGSAPDPAGGAYSAPPDPLAGFKGATSKERRGKREKENGKEKGREREERRERKEGRRKGKESGGRKGKVKEGTAFSS